MGTLDAFLRESGIRVLRDAPLGLRTTFRIGGPARALAMPATVDELGALWRACRETETPVRILGSGANLLVRDRGFDGVVIHLGRLSAVSIRGEQVDAEAGASFPKLVISTVQAGLEGLDGLAGIPASVGGAIFMNAGGRHGEIFDVVESVRTLDPGGKVVEQGRTEIPYGYRRSGLEGHVVLGGRFRLRPADPRVVRERFEAVVRSKRASQPMRERSAGCIFKNPPAMSAGRAIDESGFKGARVGDAVVSSKHANFIVNAGRASSEDVLALIERVRDGVRARLSIDLSMEVLVW